jgi:HEPN domain-containing protein
MKRPLSPREVPSEWFRKADKDLKMAEIALRETDEVNDLISFHAQQCTEKYLKGALVFLKIQPPKTHDLSRLYDLLTPFWPDIPFTAREVIGLTLYAISSRYPDEWEDISIDEARQAVAMAKRVRKAVKAFLKERGFVKA